jgi:hypothetical protein
MRLSSRRRIALRRAIALSVSLYGVEIGWPFRGILRLLLLWKGAALTSEIESRVLEALNVENESIYNHR